MVLSRTVFWKDILILFVKHEEPFKSVSVKSIFNIQVDLEGILQNVEVFLKHVGSIRRIIFLIKRILKEQRNISNTFLNL